MKKAELMASMALGLGMGYAVGYMKKNPLKMKTLKNDMKNMVKDLK